jgi:hypothetical protein
MPTRCVACPIACCLPYYCPWNHPGKSAFAHLSLQDALLEITGGRSVPRVFIGGKFLGGGDDTVAAAANGKLKSLLEEVGAL